MDKRSIATRKKIKDTYVDMLMNKQKVHVRTLVKLANINKSTFYRYYTYIEELEDELLRELTREAYDICLKGDPNKNFTERFFDYYENLDERKKTLFNSNINRTTELFVDLAFENLVRTSDDKNKQLTFYIVSSGCIKLFLDRKYPREDKKKAIIEFATKASKYFSE